MPTIVVATLSLQLMQPPTNGSSSLESQPNPCLFSLPPSPPRLSQCLHMFLPHAYTSQGACWKNLHFATGVLYVTFGYFDQRMYDLQLATMHSFPPEWKSKNDEIVARSLWTSSTLHINSHLLPCLPRRGLQWETAIPQNLPADSQNTRTPITSQ